MESLAAKLGRLTEKIADKGKWKQYVEASTNCKSLEAKINAAESVLRTIKEVSESSPIRKHNGASDNGGVTEFTESAGGEQLTEVQRVIEKSDAILYKAMNLSEADIRRLKNLPPVGSPNLTSKQLREYRLWRSQRFSEADSLKLALQTS